VLIRGWSNPAASNSRNAAPIRVAVLHAHHPRQLRGVIWTDLERRDQRAGLSGVQLSTLAQRWR
jgi:hypothetical protein